MSKRTRLHRPNVAMIDVSPEMSVPDNLPRPQTYHPCGLCMRGGGTLKKIPVDIQMVEFNGVKLRTEVPRDGKKHLYEHTEPRFCRAWHVPKRFFLAVQRMARQEDARQRREFHETGRISRGGHKKVAFQRKSV